MYRDNEGMKLSYINGVHREKQAKYRILMRFNYTLLAVSGNTLFAEISKIIKQLRFANLQLVSLEWQIIVFRQNIGQNVRIIGTLACLTA